MNEVDVKEVWEASRKVYNEHSFIEGAYLTNVDVVDGWALPLRNNKPALPSISGLIWQQEHIDHVMKTEWDKTPCKMTLDDEKVVLLSFPGGYTYGHWIIDIITRLELTEKTLIKEKVKYIIPGPPQSWFMPFLDAFGLTLDMCVPLASMDKVHVKRLYVPSFMRVNDYLPDKPFSDSFARLRSHGQRLAGAVQERERCRKLWVRRTMMTDTSRPGLDEESLVGLMNELGFQTVTPSAMSIGEQAAIFDAADIIVGEDSSALHNIVWGSPKKLVVLHSKGSINLLHFSMCAILNIVCQYVAGVMLENGKFSVDHSTLRAAIVES